MEFPRLVYKSADEHQLVADSSELSAACKCGWFASVPEALANAPAAAEQDLDNTPPTRAELELKAKELKIKFSTKTTDAKLGALIAKKL